MNARTFILLIVPPDIAPSGSVGRLIGRIGEFMIFGRILTSDERATVETYFNRRYSFW
jgi:hypothetical protein